jgi:hypothetical protein
MIVAGWGERGPEAFMVSSFDGYGDRAMTVMPVGDIGLLGATPEIGAAVRKWIPSLRSCDFDPDIHGLPLLELERTTPQPVPGQQALLHIVGGFGQLTTVRRDSIETRILARWPDKIGERIKP